MRRIANIWFALAATCLLGGCSGGDASQSQLLDEAEREYLWNVEHQVLVLKKHGFGPLREALRSSDFEAVANSLAPDFSARGSSAPTQVTDRAWGRVQRSGPAHEAAPLSREAFLKLLTEARQRFDAEPVVQFGVADVAPVDRQNWEGPWAAHVKLRMAGTSADGPAEVLLELQLQLALPTEENLAAGWWKSCEIEATTWAESPRPLFIEVAAQRGLAVERLHDNWTSDLKLANSTGGIYLLDYNRDGRLDMLVTDFDENYFYRGIDGGRFEDVTAEVGLVDTVTGGICAAAADLDNDGWTDLILDTRIYRNDQGKQFVEVTDRCRLSILIGPSSIIPADYDRDGLIDLYVTNWGSQQGRGWADDRTATPCSNQLWHNQGDWQFENVTQQAGASGDDRAVFASVWCDVNDDLWPDLYVINELGRGLLLVNDQQGAFHKAQLTDGPGDHGSMGVTAGDVDRNGHIDLYVANMYSKSGRRVINNVCPGTYTGELQDKLEHSFGTGSQLYLNQGFSGHQPQFKTAGEDWHAAHIGWSYGVCLADLDNDGWLDLYACSGFVSHFRDKPDG